MSIRPLDFDSMHGYPIHELAVLGDRSLYDPETQDSYGLEAVPEHPYPLLVVGYGRIDTVGERTRKAVEESIHSTYRVPADWSLSLLKERQEGGEIRDGRGSWDTDFEMKVLDPSGEPYADLLVYRLEIEGGRVVSAWFVIG